MNIDVDFTLLKPTQKYIITIKNYNTGEGVTEETYYGIRTYHIDSESGFLKMFDDEKVYYISLEQILAFTVH